MSENVTTNDKVKVKDRFPPWALVGLAALLALGVWGGDRVGWEGDDLAIMFGATYLDHSTVDVYRYAWQPLAYEALHALGRVGVRGLDLTYVGNLAGMVGVWLLILLAWRTTIHIVPQSGVLSVVLGLSMAEVWFTALYFNTTAIALPWFVGSLHCLHLTETSGRRPPVFWSGLLFGISCLLRLDFAAAGAFVLLMVCRLSPAPTVRSVLIWLGGVCAPLAAWMLIDSSIALAAIGIASAYEDGQSPWGVWMSIKVAVVALGPALVVFPILLARRLRATASQGATVLSLVPMLLPLLKLYSPKYLVPLFCCMLWLAARDLGCRNLCGTPGKHWSTRLYASAAILAVSAFVSPMHEIVEEHRTSRPRMLFTHDGYRTAGDYFSILSLLRRNSDRPPHVQPFLDLAYVIEECPLVQVLLYPTDNRPAFFNEWNLGWVPLHLAARDWYLQEYRSSGTATMTSPTGDRQVTLVAPSRRDAPTGPLAPDRVIAFGDSSAVGTSEERAWRTFQRDVMDLRANGRCGAT